MEPLKQWNNRAPPRKTHLVNLQALTLRLRLTCTLTYIGMLACCFLLEQKDTS